MSESLRPALTGLFASLIAALPFFLGSGHWRLAPLVLIPAGVAMVLQRFVIERNAGSPVYDGLADLYIHIHAPSAPDSALRWALRGSISLLLALMGGLAGVEGAAIELSHAAAMRLRSRSSRWFEQRRRTDAAVCVAAGVSAAFGAPFAAIVLPLELSLGGRTLASAVSAIAAYLGFRLLESASGFQVFDFGGALFGVRFDDWRQWVAIAAVGVCGGILGALLVRAIRYAQDSLLDLFQTQSWMRTLAGGVMLFLVVLIFKAGHAQPWALLEQAFWGKFGGSELWLILCTQMLALALVLSAFGTLGLFWPLFAIGGFLGAGLAHGLLAPVLKLGSGAVAAAGLAGSASIWGAVLGAPLAGGLVAYETTRDVHVLLPCLVAAFTARAVRMALRTPALVDKDLEARGVSLLEGRETSVLEAVIVRDAMVADHEIVYEQEPVSQIHARLLKSRYPFLPVVNSQGAYRGLLTVDMVQEAWQSQETATSNSPLSKLLEAKDLLYRSPLKPPTVKLSDKLSAAVGLFEDLPCLPVVGDGERVQGLLFAYAVRLAYDREVARRSLAPHASSYVSGYVLGGRAKPRSAP